VLAQIRYQQEVSRFEERLGRYLSEHEGANEQLGRMARAVWRRTPEYLRLEFGADEASLAGAVGRSRVRIREVAYSGNLRERVTFLFLGLSCDLIPRLLGGAEIRPGEITVERADRRDAESRNRFQERIKAIDESNMHPADKESAKRAAVSLIQTTQRASEVRPPLSAAERWIAGDGEPLPWLPAETDITLRMESGFQQRSESTGGLVRTGTSGSAYRFIRCAVWRPRSSGRGGNAAPSSKCQSWSIACSHAIPSSAHTRPRAGTAGALRTCPFCVESGRGPARALAAGTGERAGLWGAVPPVDRSP
jgi:hypothetical protein